MDIKWQEIYEDVRIVVRRYPLLYSKKEVVNKTYKLLNSRDHRGLNNNNLFKPDLLGLNKLTIKPKSP